MTCARCAELEERVAWLEAQAREEKSLEMRAFIRKDLGLTPQQVEVLLTLKDANGRILSPYAIDDRIPNKNPGDPRDPKQIGVQIYHIRKRLGANVIDNVWGQGFKITPVGLRIVSEVMKRAAERSAVPHVA